MEQSRVTGAAGGAMSGAATGATLGSVIPGLGTAVGAAAGGVVGGVMGALGGGGEDDIEDMIEAQERAIDAQLREQQRQTRNEMERTVGLAVATTGANNLQLSGSTRNYIGAIESEYRQTMNWDSYAARLQKDVIQKGGQMAIDQVQRQGIGQVIKGATSLAMVGAKSGWGAEKDAMPDVSGWEAADRTP